MYRDKFKFTVNGAELGHSGAAQGRPMKMSILANKKSITPMWIFLLR